jgi:hypothetical protein
MHVWIGTARHGTVCHSSEPAEPRHGLRGLEERCRGILGGSLPPRPSRPGVLRQGRSPQASVPSRACACACVRVQVFDFGLLKSFVSRKDFHLVFDAMWAVTGPYAKRILVEVGARMGTATSLPELHKCRPSSQTLWHRHSLVRRELAPRHEPYNKLARHARSAFLRLSPRSPGAGCAHPMSLHCCTNV